MNKEEVVLEMNSERFEIEGLIQDLEQGLMDARLAAEKLRTNHRVVCNYYFGPRLVYIPGIPISFKAKRSTTETFN